MNTKLRIKQRREERIRRLLDGAAMEMMQEANPGPSKKIAESLRPTSSLIYRIRQDMLDQYWQNRKGILNGCGKRERTLRFRWSYTF
ncbi:hypothetical protein N6H13_23145 [Paenibacillus sp. CC-CFT742]|nr:hypothetical protein [Paenibacillus sp. CC-CFT742]WJH27995.1 hypothetical protein N6H13_23145 [Paenibacillus sp. CC-CFT742]